MLKFLMNTVLIVLGLFIHSSNLYCTHVTGSSSDLTISHPQSSFNAEVLERPCSGTTQHTFLIEATEEGEEDELNLIELSDFITGYFGLFSVFTVSKNNFASKICPDVLRHKHFLKEGRRCLALQVFRI